MIRYLDGPERDQLEAATLAWRAAGSPPLFDVNRRDPWLPENWNRVAAAVVKARAAAVPPLARALRAGALQMLWCADRVMGGWEGPWRPGAWDYLRIVVNGLATTVRDTQPLPRGQKRNGPWYHLRVRPATVEPVGPEPEAAAIAAALGEELLPTPKLTPAQHFDLCVKTLKEWAAASPTKRTRDQAEVAAALRRVWPEMRDKHLRAIRNEALRDYPVWRRAGAKPKQ